uniref:Killer cell lectin-like receptor subfamily G member 1 n=1 Tax=Mus spicilegus TaxID=10103 RepID=A0A8C6IEB1_MUSSI
MADSSIYSTLELPEAPRVQDASRWKLKAVLHRPRLSCVAMVAFGLLTVILMSLLMYQRILCCGSKDSTRSHCPSCPILWTRNGSHCYYFSMEKKDWNSSLKFCADKGSHLLTFPDNQGVVNENISHYRWLGATMWLLGFELRSSIRAVIRMCVFEHLFTHIFVHICVCTYAMVCLCVYMCVCLCFCMRVREHLRVRVCSKTVESTAEKK